MTSSLAWLSLAVFGWFTHPCGSDADAHWRALLFLEVNVERLEQGLRPLQPIAALCSHAQRRAGDVAVSMGTQTEAEEIGDSSTDHYRAGYQAHRWYESTTIGYRMTDLLPDWRETSPAGWEEVARGDYESIGVGLDFIGPQPVFTLVVALSKRTWEWRQAAELEDLDRVRDLVLQRTNVKRAGKGLPPLVQQADLERAAQRHAEDLMRNEYYSHQDREGGSVYDRARRAGYDGARFLAENLAKGLFTPEEVVDRWMNSPGHRSNILSNRAEEMGLGVAFGEPSGELEVLWVQVFGRPQKRE